MHLLLLMSLLKESSFESGQAPWLQKTGVIRYLTCTPHDLVVSECLSASYSCLLNISGISCLNIEERTPTISVRRRRESRHLRSFKDV